MNNTLFFKELTVYSSLFYIFNPIITVMGSRIMIVDDEEDTVKLIKTLLEREGYDAVAASSASECLEKLGENNVDLILVDMMMPHMNGRDLCIKIRGRKKFDQVKIIYLSVMKPTEYEKRYGEGDLQELNILDYILKPFDNRDLISRVKSMLS